MSRVQNLSLDTWCFVATMMTEIHSVMVGILR